MVSVLLDCFAALAMTLPCVARLCEEARRSNPMIISKTLYRKCTIRLLRALAMTLPCVARLGEEERRSNLMIIFKLIAPICYYVFTPSMYNRKCIIRLLRRRASSSQRRRDLILHPIILTITTSLRGGTTKQSYDYL